MSKVSYGMGLSVRPFTLYAMAIGAFLLTHWRPTLHLIRYVHDNPITHFRILGIPEPILKEEPLILKIEHLKQLTY